MDRYAAVVPIDDVRCTRDRQIEFEIRGKREELVAESDVVAYVESDFDDLKSVRTE